MLTWLPVCRAHFPVLLHVLDGLRQFKEKEKGTLRVIAPSVVKRGAQALPTAAQVTGESRICTDTLGRGKTAKPHSTSASQAGGHGASGLFNVRRRRRSGGLWQRGPTHAHSQMLQMHPRSHLQQPQRLVHRAANGNVIDRDLLDHTLQCGMPCEAGRV